MALHLHSAHIVERYSIWWWSSRNHSSVDTFAILTVRCVCVHCNNTKLKQKTSENSKKKKNKNNVRSIIHNHSMALFVSTIHFVIYCLANCSRTVKISSDIYDRQRFIALCWTLFSIIYCFGCMCGVLHGHQTPSPRGCINIVSVGRFIIAS